MKDQFGRTIQYLRVSITDKCNLRCVYCMPLEGLEWLQREQILDYEEIAQIIRAMAPMGLERVRITGGEPLVRRDVPELVKLLAAVPGIRDLSLSTTAVLLGEQADALRSAGVQRLNVSLDSLQPDRVDSIARRPGSYPKIMEGLDAAERVGFAPIKINVVLIRGQNDDEIRDFAEITRERPWHVRFIEMMPTGANLDLSANQFVSCDEAVRTVREIAEIEPVAHWGGS
jgi:cyclic pyranopterin phosphate synthase